MSNKNIHTDAELDKMLGDMLRYEKSEVPRPPVINAYRLEKDRQRQEKRFLVILSSIAAAVSTICITILVYITAKIYSREIHEFIQKICDSKLYTALENFLLQYRMEITAILAAILLIFALSALILAMIPVGIKLRTLRSHH